MTVLLWIVAAQVYAGGILAIYHGLCDLNCGKCGSAACALVWPMLVAYRLVKRVLA